jgi:hypothetical protein
MNIMQIQLQLQLNKLIIKLSCMFTVGIFSAEISKHTILFIYDFTLNLRYLHFLSRRQKNYDLCFVRQSVLLAYKNALTVRNVTMPRRYATDLTLQNKDSFSI